MPYASGMWDDLHQVAKARLLSGDPSSARAFVDFALSHVLVGHDALNGDDRRALCADTGSAHALLAGACMASGQVSEAWAHLHRAAAAFESAGDSIVSHADELSSPLAWQALLRALSAERQHLAPNELASLVGVAEDFAVEGPADAWVTALRGLLYRQLGRPDDAMDVLASAQAANPQEPHIARALARLHIERGAFHTARDVLQALAETEGSDGETLLLLATLDAREQRWDDAIAAYRQARALLSESVEARIGLTAALKAAGRLEEALATLDERRDGGRSADEWALRAAILLALARWDEALASLRAARAGGLPPQAEGQLHLERARGLHESGRLLDADAALDEAERLSIPAEDVVDLRLAILSGAELWDKMLACANKALTRRPGDERLTAAKARSLRNLRRHDEALQTMLTLSAPEEVATIRLCAVLKCEVGDFQGALETVRPWTQDRAAVEPELLGIEGWAHQNCGGSDHAREAERVYSRALAKKPDDPWYRKGLANALRHQQRGTEARAEYAKVIDMVKGASADHLTSAYLTCLSGWCRYCLGDFDQAADCYASGLAVAPLGVACQFDHGLILLAGGYAAAAREEYQRAFKDLRELTPLRRCGLLYVALVDLRDAPSIVPALGTSPKAAAIRADLRASLEQAAAELQPEFADLGARMSTFASLDAVTSPAAMSTTPAALAARQDWGEYSVVAGAAGAASAGGILLPVVTRPAEPDVYHILHPTGLGEALTREAYDRDVREGRVLPLPFEAAASLGASVLVVTLDLLDNAGLSTLEGLETGVEWHRTSVPGDALVACAAVSVGERLFDRLARRLVSRVIDAAKASPPSGDVEPAIRRTAEQAVAVVCDPYLAYQAVLAYAIAVGDSAPACAQIAARRPPAAKLLQAQTGWAETVLGFRELLHLVAEVDRGREDGRARAASGLQRQLLQRAREVASLPDAVDQDRRALCAALEVQAITLMTPDREAQRAALARRLESQAHVTLDTLDAVLLMAARPTFYAPSVVRGDAPPTVNAFAYASRVRQGDRPQGGMVKYASARR